MGDQPSPPPPLDAKTQLGSYALEMLGSTDGTRLHCLGMLLRNDLVSLWYFDASGVVCAPKSEGRGTKSLSLINDFEHVAGIFIALAYCDEEQFGAIPKSILARPSNYNFPASDLSGHTVDFSSEIEKSSVPSSHSYPCDSSFSTSSTFDSDSVSHSSSHSSSDGPPFVVTLGEHIYTQYTLIGRRTTVYHGTSTRTGCENVVVKMSQQYRTRASEADFIAMAHNKGIHNIPEVLHSKDLWRMSDDGTIRRAFGVPYDDRVLRCIVMPYYKPLAVKLAEDPDSLKTMARQMIACA
jgi:hypothetical protein